MQSISIHHYLVDPYFASSNSTPTLFTPVLKGVHGQGQILINKHFYQLLLTKGPKTTPTRAGKVRATRAGKVRATTAGKVRATRVGKARATRAGKVSATR